MAKTKAEAKPTGVNAPATKRDVNKLMREAESLWTALTEVECNMNVVVNALLDNDFGPRNIALTIEQGAALERIRTHLQKFREEPLVEQGELFT